MRPVVAARRRLAALGVRSVSGVAASTFAKEARFYSYRRAATTGRMATLVWIASDVRAG